MNYIGARVIIACRNLDKGRQAIENLINETNCNKQQIRLMECDLCSFDSVRNFAKTYNNEEEKLDILICNAGLSYPSNEITKDGFNYVIQANYLGHFLLTNLLLNKLKESKPSRILNISSDLHKSLFNYSKIFELFLFFKLSNLLIGQMHLHKIKNPVSWVHIHLRNYFKFFQHIN